MLLKVGYRRCCVVIPVVTTGTGRRGLSRAECWRLNALCGSNPKSCSPGHMSAIIEPARDPGLTDIDTVADLDLTPPVRESRHGKGTAILRANGCEAMFTNLSYTYPLKILSPQASSSLPVGIAYIISYGGGLVSGDRIDLDIDVGEGAYLVLLTQVGTRTFEHCLIGTNLSESWHRRAQLKCLKAVLYTTPVQPPSPPP
jgi:hypothetical protein